MEVRKCGTQIAKIQVQCENDNSGHKRDLSRVERLLRWFLSLRMKVEVCVNVHAPFFEGKKGFLK